MRRPPRPNDWADVTIRMVRFLFPALNIVAAEVEEYRELHRDADDPPPCLECPTRVVYYCMAEEIECRCFKAYVAREVD